MDTLAAWYLEIIMSLCFLILSWGALQLRTFRTKVECEGLHGQCALLQKHAMANKANEFQLELKDRDQQYSSLCLKIDHLGQKVENLRLSFESYVERHDGQ